MKKLTVLLLIALSFSFSATKNNLVENPKKLNGTWIPIRQEMGGMTLPPAAFEKQKLIISDSTYTVIAESTDKGIIKCTSNKMDIYGKDGVNAGKHFTALYKLEKGQLAICYNLAGDAYPENFETKGKPKFFLSVFKKETK
jgi:uncharacterized protein (TIGR03067 family)